MPLSVPIRIAATFTADPLIAPLRYLLHSVGMSVDVSLCQYNQVFQELIRPDSELSRNRSGVNVLLIRIEDWTGLEQHALSDLHVDDQAAKNIERNVADFVNVFEAAALRCSAPFLVCLCPESAVLSRDPNAKAFVDAIEAKLKAGIERHSNGYFLSPQFISDMYPVDRYDDPASNRLGHVPYTAEFFAAIALSVARRAYRLRTTPPKVIILDLDNTLWTGVAGEDGPRGVVIDDTRRFLQQFMLDQQKAGAVLCICSKNNEEDAWAVFRERDDMVLRPEHFVAHRINWDHKSRNIRSLAAELNLGLDSMVFVDDDSAVCAEVRHACPQVSVIQLPADIRELPRLFRHLWVFDRLKVTKEDLRRTESYQENAAREQVRKAATNFDDFLAGLGLEISVALMQPEHLARVSQLTFRTNQFNCTTIRRSEGELRELLATEKLSCHVTHVKDRFGDYGLVGVTLHEVSGNSLVVESFMMSCRVLGRGVEHKMISTLGTVASERGLKWVDLRYVQTAKNRPAIEFLESLANAERLQADGVSVFRLAAEHASTLDCRSFEAADAVKAPDEAVEPPANQSGISIDALLQIATDYPTVSSLISRIEQPRTASNVKSEYQSPSTETESQLVQIWQEILHVDRVGINDNFFDLGGDSFKAVTMFALIQERLGHDLGLATLFDAPTVAQLAQVMHGTMAVAWSCLVPIQPNGSKPVLYCMHAAGGNVLFYKDLAKHLGPDQPVYGLQAQGLSKTRPWQHSVEEMADCYLREIKAFQPEGPYLLAGSSFGGLLAYEMARQLEQSGERVGLLALFDTYGPSYPKYPAGVGKLKKKIYFNAARIEMHWSNLKALDNWRGRIAYIIDRTQRAKKQVRRKWKLTKNEIASSYLAAAGKPLPAPLLQGHKAISEALAKYQYPEFTGNMVLFRALKQPIGALPDRELGWTNRVKGEIEVVDVQGHHGAVTVDPHAAFLATKLAPYLEAVHRRHTRPSGSIAQVADAV